MSEAAPPAPPKTNIHYVSCLVHNPTDPIPPERRLAWLKALFDHGPFPMTLYADLYYASQISVADHPGLRVIPWSLSDSRVAKATAAAAAATAASAEPLQLPQHRNAAKDTEFFMTLMHCKAELVAMTAAAGPTAEFYAFLDAGIVKIFRSPATSVQALRDLRIGAPALNGRVLVPGCWVPCTHTFEALASRICWVFCGGFFVVEAATAPLFEAAQGRALQTFLDAGRITWEVNTWVQMLRDEAAPDFAWFSADHNDTMVTAVPKEFIADATTAAADA
jgi:hypothetical protein